MCFLERKVTGNHRLNGVGISNPCKQSQNLAPLIASDMPVFVGRVFESTFNDLHLIEITAFKMSLNSDQRRKKTSSDREAGRITAYGETALHLATKGSLEGLLKVLAEGIALNVQDYESGYTALHKVFACAQLYCLLLKYCSFT